MRHDDRDASPIREVATKFGTHVGSEFGIECRERFVEQQHVGLGRESARESDALGLPAR